MDKLTEDYIKRSELRLKVLDFYLSQNGYPDAVRESQELVELLLKAVLRHKGIEVPKTHDVSKTIIKYIEIMPPAIKDNIEKIASISKYLRKDRELSFYGEEDFIPSEEYTEEEARRAIESARFVFGIVKKSF